MLQSKIQQARDHYAAGRYNKALAIISKFTRETSKEEQRTLQIAKECVTGNESFYKSLGIDVTYHKAKAREIIELKFIK